MYLESQIYTRLHALQLSHWNHVFATLALHYAGLELVMEAYDTPPLRGLADVLDAVEPQPHAWRDRALFDALINTPLFCWHASNETGHWHPLREPLSHFEKRGHTAIWYDDRPHPTPQLAALWLGKQLLSLGIALAR